MGRLFRNGKSTSCGIRPFKMQNPSSDRSSAAECSLVIINPPNGIEFSKGHVLNFSKSSNSFNEKG